MSDLTAWIQKNRALWTRVYDEVIAPDMEAEWQKREEVHQEELRKREENRLIVFKRMEEEVVRSSLLATENQQLKYQLEQSAKNVTPDGDPGLMQTHQPRKPHGVEDRLADRYNELSKRYEDLEQQIKYLRRKNNDVMQKNKDMKESVRSWQEYVDRQAAKQRAQHEAKTHDNHIRLSAIPQIDDARPHAPSSPRSIATVRTPLSLADQGLSSPAPMPLLGPSDVQGEADNTLSNNLQGPEPDIYRASVTPKPSGSNGPRDQIGSVIGYLPSVPSSSTVPNEHIERRAHSYLQASNPSSSQTTVEEPGDPPTRRTQSNMTADDDDVPQFVSARSVNKRKRGHTPKIEIYGERSDGTPIKPFRVKEEPGSSPPSAYSLLRKDTVDLDAPASGILQTPHHPRHQRSSSAPMSQRNIQALRHMFPVATVNPGAADLDSRALSEPSDNNNIVSDDVLQELDPNAAAEPQEHHSGKRVKLSDGHGQKARHFFSESGEEPPPSDENELRLPPSKAKARLSRKLHSSIGPPSLSSKSEQPSARTLTAIEVEQDPVSSAASKRSRQTPVAKNRLREPPKTSKSTPKANPTLSDRSQWQMKALESCSTGRKPPTAQLGKQDPLRSKPIGELKPADFKFNPAYNQGYSYAFSETVRKRGERACLPGCTDPQCCGSKFRAFAEVQAPLPVSQEEALLEDYLGEAYDSMNLTQMASDERRELVLQARARKMAKDAGKHREAYERRRTPPGFWRVDFPSTQELEEDRRKAKELEKELVRERWLETQRKGGKWIFRDE